MAGGEAEFQHLTSRACCRSLQLERFVFGLQSSHLFQTMLSLLHLIPLGVLKPYATVRYGIKPRSRIAIALGIGNKEGFLLMQQ